MTQSFRYRAFLSYSHADEAAATRLHRALESYVLPRRVRKAHALPRRLIPIFRDVDELAAASGLTTRLQDALDQSQWLIVLCSPASAQSKYVNQEIEYFLQKHGASRILCALISGEPAESFPAAIKSLPEEPLAADFRPGKDFELSKLKLIAALAGVGFTELRNREVQRRKRQQLIAAALLAGIGLGGLAYWDLYQREHVGYYLSYVRRHGIWEGVDRISPEAARHRAVSYQFTQRGRARPPDRVQYYKGCGTDEKLGMPDVVGNIPPEGYATNRAFCAASFAYHTDGTIAHETLHNKMGIAIETLTYTSPTLAQFTQEGFAASRARSGIFYVEFTRDERGFDATVRFLQKRGVPRANNARDYGYRYAYDDAGRVIRKAPLDTEAAESHATIFAYDPQGFLMEERQVDAVGKLRLGADARAVTRYTNDEWGNPIRKAYLDLQGSPALDREGAASKTFSYDADGNLVEEWSFDERGDVAANPQGFAGIRREFNQAGHRVRIRYYGKDRNPATDDEGAAGWWFDVDEFGNARRVGLFGLDGQPAISHSSAASWSFTFDSRGNNTSTRFFGLKGEPVVTTWGAESRRKFDDSNNLVELSHFDTTGKPFAPQGWDGPVVQIRYDEHGNDVETFYVDAGSKPVKTRWGWTYFIKTYDEVGNLVQRHYLDQGRQPVMSTLGWSIWRNAYDRFGNATQDRVFGPDGKPVKPEFRDYGQDSEHDSRGRMTRVTFVGDKGQPAIQPLGFVSIRYQYDVFGRRVEQTYFDIHDRPLSGGRISRKTYAYDGHGRELASHYFDANGKPVIGPYAYASMLIERDRYGRVIRERCLDTNGKPVNQTPADWATHTVTYGDGPQVDVYFNAAGKPVKARE